MLTSLGSTYQLSSVPVEAVFQTELSFGAVVKPLLEGHVVLAPKRQVATLQELSLAESDDLFGGIPAVQRSMLEADSSILAFNIAMKDGTGAGQPVPHAHVHVVPRRSGDLERNDDIYELLDSWHPTGVNDKHVTFDVPSDDRRKPRTPDDMASEAATYADDEFYGPVKFGKFDIDHRQVFYASESSVAIVNLKPLVPGHVLVIPRRVVPTLRDLSPAEATDLWRSARAVHHRILSFYGSSSANLAIQDGIHAGQSVPHVHVHILPR